MQGSLFGLAGLLPVSYTAPIMSGQGLAGLFAAVAMICAIASESCLLPVSLDGMGREGEKRDGLALTPDTVPQLAQSCRKVPLATSSRPVW